MDGFITHTFYIRVSVNMLVSMRVPLKHLHFSFFLINTSSLSLPLWCLKSQWTNTVTCVCVTCVCVCVWHKTWNQKGKKYHLFILWHPAPLPPCTHTRKCTHTHFNGCTIHSCFSWTVGEKATHNVGKVSVHVFVL